MFINISTIGCIKVKGFPSKSHSTVSTDICKAIKVLQTIYTFRIVQTIYQYEDIQYLAFDCNCCNHSGKM